MGLPTDIRAELERFKANSKLFAMLDAPGLERMARIAKHVDFPLNSRIIREGERGDTFYVIVHGGVRVTTDGLDQEKEVARLGPGAFFGEMAVLNDEPRTASVTTIGDVACLAFDKAGVLAILQDYPNIHRLMGLVGLKRAEQLIDAQLED